MTTLPADDPRHGTLSAYTNQACRCEQCKAANTQSCRAWRETHRERYNQIARDYRARKRARA